MRRPSSHTALLASRRKRGPPRARWALCAVACFGAGLLLSLARGGWQVTQESVAGVVAESAPASAAAAAVGAAAASAVVTTAAATTPHPPSKLSAHLVVYSHVDPGWLRTVDGYWEAGYKAGQAGVKHLLDGTVAALASAPPTSNRSYTWGEMIYLDKWWQQADETARAALKTAVSEGRFAFAGGGWVSPDEATSHAVDMVDALALGHDWLWRTLGAPPPTAAWQIDTFGHSAAHTALVAAAGADAMFFSRIDTEDRLHRAAAKQLEFVWDSAPGAARGVDVWCYAFHGGVYDIPPTLEALQLPVPSDPAAADAEWADRVERVRAYVTTVASASRGAAGPVMISIARDFGFDDIGVLYANLDELVARAADAGLDLTYATAPQHAATRAADPRAAWPVQQGDLFPYSDCKGCYWSGYFSTRPGTKRLVREASGVLAAARQAEVWGAGAATAAVAGPSPAVETLARAVALMQHHDAITGTDMAAVNADYRRTVTAALHGGRRVIGAALDAKVFGGGGATPKLGGRKAGPDAAGAVGADGAATPTLIPGFTFCDAANASVCAPAVALSDRLAPFTVAATSALPHGRVASIEVPLGATAATVGWTAVAVDDGTRVRAQIVPTRADTRALHAHLVAVQAAQSQEVAAATAVFEGRVPGMGYRVWTLVPDEGGSRGGSAGGGGPVTAAPPPPVSTTACSSHPSNCTDDGEAVTVTNGVVTLTFSRARAAA